MIRWPKHRGFRFSLRTLFVLMTLVGVAIAWRTQPPLVITLDTPQHASHPVYCGTIGVKGIIQGYEPGWFRVPARLMNVSRSRIWFPGYSVDRPFYEIHTRRSSTEEWKPSGLRYCGTDVRVFPLEPGETATFDVWVLPCHQGADLTVTLAACTADSNPDDDTDPSASFEVVSAAVTLP